MHIDSIHAGRLALAHAVVVAAQARAQSTDTGHAELVVSNPGKACFAPLQRLARWWRGLDALGARTDNPLQLMLWSESWGRPYTASLGLVLLMNHVRKGSIRKPPLRPLAL
jgi:hypothetical protein